MSFGQGEMPRDTGYLKLINLFSIKSLNSGVAGLMRIITSDTMRSIDHKTISEGHVEGRILMERAGIGAVKELLKYAALLNEKFCERFVILCGKGNNGGDGYVMAKALMEQGKRVKILSVCPLKELRGDALYHAELIADKVDFELIDEPGFASGDFIVDCLLGTGLNSDVKEPYSSIIKSVNESGCPVASLDIASGLNGNDGSVHGIAVKADITLTIGFPKTGLLLGDGPEYTGRLKCIDIGFPDEIAKQFPHEGEMICEHELRKIFSRRSPSSHKYNFGNVLVIGGSRNYGGAPFLTGGAAARSGAGMVSVYYPDSVSASGADSLIKIPGPSSKEGCFAKKAALEVRNHFKKKDIIVIGPGMTGDREELYILETVMKSDMPVLADAGALNLLSENSDLFKRESLTVITPHAGELKKLLEGTGLKSARELAEKFKILVLEKGQFSELFTADGKSVRNSTGCNALATAGSGDVLAGITGAFISWNKDFFEAVISAMAVHGLCGEYSPNGVYGSLADDFIERIPFVLKSLSPHC